MSSPKDTSAETFRSGQDAVVAALESWTESAKSAWANAPGVSGQQVDPQQVIDQVFDFAEKMLEGQRDFAKKMLGVSEQVGQAARTELESAGEKVRGQVEAGTDAARKQAETIRGQVEERTEAARAPAIWGGRSAEGPAARSASRSCLNHRAAG